MENLGRRFLFLGVLTLILTLVASLQAINQNSINQLVSNSTLVLDLESEDDDDSGRVQNVDEEELHHGFEIPGPFYASCLNSNDFPAHLDISPQSLYLKFHKPPSVKLG